MNYENNMKFAGNFMCFEYLEIDLGKGSNIEIPPGEILILPEENDHLLLFGL
jgi:hypothetical protein